MKNGNWVPISKAFLRHLPHDRLYSKVEAILSIQCDYDQDNKVTVAGYASLWRWSRNKVKSFLDELGVDIEYPESTGKRQNQKGQIKGQIKDRSGTDKGQIRFIDSKGLPKSKDRKRTDKGQIKDRSKDTTNDPILNNNPKPLKITYPEWLDMALWNDFREFRKHKDRKALSYNAELLNLRKLIALQTKGHDPKEMIEKTIGSNWASFFPPDSTKGTDGSYASLPRNEDGETEFVQRMREEDEEKERQANG